MIIPSRNMTVKEWNHLDKLLAWGLKEHPDFTSFITARALARKMAVQADIDKARVRINNRLTVIERGM